MQTFRTPEDRFAALADFPYPPQYGEVPDGDGGTLRMAYVASGPADGPVVLLLHGEPTWSYLYRSMLPVLADAGIRAVAVDLVGFGRSDKPTELADHSYARHVAWVRALAFDVLDLHDVTLFGQDWGGLIGLRLAAEHPDRFAALIAGNTGLPTGDRDMPPEWHAFRDAVLRAETLDVGRFVQGGTRTRLSADVRAAYDAPFPDESSKVAVRAMPQLVPIRPDDPAAAANRAAWEVLTRWEKPFLCTFSDGDPITGGMAPILRKLIPGAANRDHPTITNAAHFLQEDAGPHLATVIADFVTALPDRS